MKNLFKILSLLLISITIFTVSSCKLEEKTLSDKVVCQIKLPPAKSVRDPYTSADAKMYKVTAIDIAEQSNIVTEYGKPGTTITLTLTKESTYVVSVVAYLEEAMTTEIATGTSEKVTLTFSAEPVPVNVKLTAKEKPTTPDTPTDGKIDVTIEW